MLAGLVATLFCQGGLAADLGRLLSDPALSRAHAGVIVKQFDGPVLFDSAGDKRFIPASVLKMATVAACLNELSPDRPLVTRYWRSGNTLSLVGGWDPDLTIQDLEQIRSRLTPKPGDKLVFWDRADEDDATNSGWERGDEANEDAAPITSLTVNRGRAELWLRGGKLTLEPRNFGMSISRESSVGELRIRRNEGSWVVRVWGKLPDADARLGSVSLTDPALCAARIVSASAQRKKLSIAAAQSFAPRTLADVCRAALVESNNHTADTLLRLLGAAKGKSSSWEDSLAVVRGFLGKMGVSQESMRLSDGSGLSRFNEISPRTVVTLLEWTLRSQKGNIFASMLPAPGEGTLKNRLSGVAVRAKTGTMTGISGLAGFVDIPPSESNRPKLLIQSSSRRVLFCIFFNHYPAKANLVRDIQDAIVRRIAQGE